MEQQVDSHHNRSHQKVNSEKPPLPFKGVLQVLLQRKRSYMSIAPVLVDSVNHDIDLSVCQEPARAAGVFGKVDDEYEP